MSKCQCIICLENAGPHDLEIHSENRMIRLCMSSCECNGFIHIKCLKDWISRDETTNKTKCPICRTRGENFTLLECYTPVPDYKTPVRHPPPTPTPFLSTREDISTRQVQPPDVYQYPRASAPAIPDVHSTRSSHPPMIRTGGLGSTIILINENTEQTEFNMDRAQEEEQTYNSQKKQMFIILILFIIVASTLWYMFT